MQGEMSYEDWKAAGYFVKKGEKRCNWDEKDAFGDFVGPKFTRSQVSPMKYFNGVKQY